VANFSLAFKATRTGQYAITFQAGGIQNTLSGLVDNLTLSLVPLPGAALLIGSALAGSGFFRRRRNSGENEEIVA
jgi:hypothetical protein